MTRVAVIDNHETIRLGVAALLERTPELKIVASHETPEALLESNTPVDVVVLDLYLGRDDELSVPAIGSLIESGMTVLLYTSEERPAPLQKAISAGASGLALKNDGADTLIAALRECAAGGFACSSTLAQALVADAELLAALTPREIDVLRGLDAGLTRGQVAGRLAISDETVRSHLKSVRAKYLDLGRQVTNATSLVREAERDGWIDRRAGNSES